MRVHTLTLLLSAAAGLSGCERISSSAVATEEMRAEFQITAEGGQARVKASLQTGALSYVVLDDGDRLVAETDRAAATLAEQYSPFDDTEYAAVVPMRRGTADVVVRFLRPGEADRHESWVEVPRQFRVWGPQRWSSVHDDGVFLEWDLDADDPVTVKVEGPCVRDYQRRINGDRGELFIEPGALEWTGVGDCEAEVTVTRSRAGHVDARFSGGRIVAHRIQRLVVPLTD